MAKDKDNQKKDSWRATFLEIGGLLASMALWRHFTKDVKANSWLKLAGECCVGLIGYFIGSEIDKSISKETIHKPIVKGKESSDLVTEADDNKFRDALYNERITKTEKMTLDR
jgi:hypothetical protein